MNAATKLLADASPGQRHARSTMRALVFRGPQQIAVETVPMPEPGFGEALIRVTLTTICGTDVHILNGEYPVRPGLILGHEAVGVVEQLGRGVSGYQPGDRVLVGAITPCGQCGFCLGGTLAQCGGTPMGGWRLGNTIHGAQAEFLLVPFAQANLAKIPDELSDEQVILLADIASTGFAAAENGKIALGDSVAIFAQGPIGLCATVGAKLRGAGLIIAVEGDPARTQLARALGADIVLDPADNVLEAVRLVTGGRGVDVSIEALGLQSTFEQALRSLRPGGTLSSLGVYSGKLTIPLEAFAAGIGDYRIVTTLCPGGKERMRRLMELVRHHRVDLTPLLTHRYPLDSIVYAYELFRSRQDGVVKIAVYPAHREDLEEQC